MITITLENFQEHVITASQLTPVLLDLGSPRSPTSQTLTSVLIRLETEFGGAFNLACANCDLVPQVAQAFQVQTVPTCIWIMNGQPMDGFSGAISEAQIREFLNKYVQAIPTEAPELIALKAAEHAAGEQDFATASIQCKAAIALNPKFVPARLMLAALFRETQPVLAQAQCDALDELVHTLNNVQLETFAALKEDIAQRLSLARSALDSSEIQALKVAIVDNAKDLTARLALAKAYQNNQAFELALEQLLFIVQTNRMFGEDIGRKTMLEIFSQASETPELVRQWRQKLSIVLN